MKNLAISITFSFRKIKYFILNFIKILSNFVFHKNFAFGVGVNLWYLRSLCGCLDWEYCILFKSPIFHVFTRFLQNQNTLEPET